MRTIDLNADLGEGCAFDAALIDRISSANVGCGAHAGNMADIRATLALAYEHGVVVGAHPGYPDRQHFGREPRSLAAEDVRQLILDQVAILRDLAGSIGVPVRYLKPHGALYNQAQHESRTAQGVVSAARMLGLPLLAQPGSVAARCAGEAGVRVILEGFVDRRYQADGRLVPRSVPGAVLSDPEEIATQLDRLLSERFESICLHGDHASSVALADFVRSRLAAKGIEIRPFLEPADPHP